VAAKVSPIRSEYTVTYRSQTLVNFPDKRPLLVGLAAATCAAGLVLLGPIGSTWRDAFWSLCIAVAAVSIGWYERELARVGHPSRLLRGVAIALVVVAIAFLAIALRRDTTAQLLS
jgi:hypothetical protein